MMKLALIRSTGLVITSAVHSVTCRLLKAELPSRSRLFIFSDDTRVGSSCGEPPGEWCWTSSAASAPVTTPASSSRAAFAPQGSWNVVMEKGMSPGGKEGDGKAPRSGGSIQEFREGILNPETWLSFTGSGSSFTPNPGLAAVGGE